MREWTYCIVLNVICKLLYCNVLCYNCTVLYWTVQFCAELCWSVLSHYLAMKHIVSHFKWMYRCLWNILIFPVASLTLVKMNDRKWISLLIIFASVLVSLPKIIFFSHTYFWLIFYFQSQTAAFHIEIIFSNTKVKKLRNNLLNSYFACRGRFYFV